LIGAVIPRMIAARTLFWRSAERQFGRAHHHRAGH
jgi:hypothetical protein